MITAIMIGPNGEKITPRYERLIFDTLEECQLAIANENLKLFMATSVELAYPGYLLAQIGCGAWDMSKGGNQPFPDLPKEFY